MRAILTALLCLLCTLAQATDHAQLIFTVRAAIREHKMLSITYEGQERVVEPHMLALNQVDDLALSAWFVSGYSKSGGGPGWRQYLLRKITAARVLSETFDGPRPGYKPDGGRMYHDVIEGL